MTNLKWLLKGDPVIVNLTKKYLLNEKTDQNDEGFISKYLSFYDEEKMTWKNGYYSPKWVSTHYTLYDLRYMEINPKNLVYQESLANYVTKFFKHYHLDEDIKKHDLCIAGMMVDMLSYGNIKHQYFFPMIDYMIDNQMTDGGWNCRFNHKPYPKISSVYTTINVLEGLSTYVNQGYTYRIDEVRKCMQEGIKVLLSRKLIFKKHTDTPIHEFMTKHHFPYRWKYDYLRILEFLAKIKYPYTDEIKPAMQILMKSLKHGKLTKGSKIPGLTHFDLEEGTYGRFNTLRAYIVLKHYEPKLYDTCLNMDFRA